MEYGINLTELTLLVLFALAGGIIFSRFKQPPILGYILCGIILGPSGFAWIQSRESVTYLSELGIIFLMFVVGFELHLAKLKNAWKLSLATMLGQVIISLIITFLLSFIFYWSMLYAILIGFIVALSSTSAIVKILETLGQTQTENGQRAIAILIAQDLAIIPMIMTLQNFHKGSFDIAVIIKVLLSFGLIGGTILFLSTVHTISLPLSRLVFRDKELVTLTSFVFCVATAWMTGQLGLSEALGAFLAGLFLGNIEQRKVLLDTIKPIQTLLLTVFFFSVGSLIDIQYIINHIGTFIFLVLLVTVGKSFINISLLRLLKLSWSDSFFIGILLAQIGEFSFLLVKLGRELRILVGAEELQIVCLTVLSLSFSSIWLSIAKRMVSLANVEIIKLRPLIDFILGQTLTSKYDKIKALFKRSTLKEPTEEKEKPQLIHRNAH